MTRTVLSASDCLLQSIAWDHFHCESFKGENISTCGQHRRRRCHTKWLQLTVQCSIAQTNQHLPDFVFISATRHGIIGPCKAPAITSSPINVFGSLTFQPICIQWTLQGCFNALSLVRIYYTQNLNARGEWERYVDHHHRCRQHRAYQAVHVFIITANIPSLC